MGALLTKGESFLVHGGAGGIGTTAIQVAKAFGSKVFTTDSPDERCSICHDLGADRVINYESEDFVEVLKNETPNRGADVILDIVGGDYIQRNIKALAADGEVRLWHNQQCEKQKQHTKSQNRAERSASAHSLRHLTHQKVMHAP